MTKVFLLGANREIDTAKKVLDLNQIVVNENGEQYVVINIFESDYREGYQYEILNIRELWSMRTRIVQPLSQKFGIGIYYDDKNPQFLTDKEVADLKEKMQAKKKAKDEEAEKKRIAREAIEAVGKEWFKNNLPSDAQAIIIACLKQDESDIQTDYHASSTVRTVILGFSTHQRDIFSEMRKCAANFEETAHLAEKNEDYEHREKYSMGKGYYLGKDYYSGWIIKKAPIYNRENVGNQFGYIAGNPDNIQLGAKSEKGTSLQAQEVINTEGLHFEIVDYSEKAIALFGDTKEIKDQLGDKDGLNGKFNSRLTHNGEKKAGWIFQKAKLDTLKQLLNIK